MIITVTNLALKEGIDGLEDNLIKRPALVNTDEIEQAITADLNRDIPIIGETNTASATQLMFRSGRTMAVMETLEQVGKLANPDS